MSKTKYLTAPVPTDQMPRGVPYIIGNEAAERFSFYGMQSILVVFMTQHLLNAYGQSDPMTEPRAKAVYHTFTAAVYFFPLLGALVADAVLGKYRTILSFSILYCLGHLALAVDHTRLGLAIGLTLIAIGAGGIKPCVSANVGDQFSRANAHLMERVYGWFYFSINLGSTFSMILTPWLLEHKSPHWAFGLPGVLMLIATIVFWAGRKRFVHVPPGGKAFLKEVVSREALTTVARLSAVYLFVIVFWALYHQNGSAWVLQAEKMDRRLFFEMPNGKQFDFEILASQVQTINGILVMAFIPLFTYWLYPTISKVFPLTPLRKISIGLFLTAAAFAVAGMAEQRIAAGLRPSVAWQFAAYAVLTAAEVMVSITCLEFSYTQAPKKLKSLIMAVYLLSISLGNVLTAEINDLIDQGRLKLAGPDYYWFFTALMLAAAVLFVFVAAWYRPRSYIQEEVAIAEP